MPYFGLASLTDPAPQTLGATSFPCFGKAPAVLFKRLAGRRPQQPDDGRRRELRELQAPTDDERQPAA